MQLAILLHLMQRRSVLPEKRTTLYERYIDIFFDREAKFQVVSDNRETLVAFHKLIAWRIHTSVEKGESTGTIHLSELKTLLTDYLTPRGLDAEIVDTLFASVTDRVLCLVQRDLDSEEFAFEVQPLREFFAAEYIYDMAPSTTANNTRSACISALVTRPYWQNVLRFLAGKLGSGEVPGLPYAIRELSEDPKLGFHPIIRDVAKLLLDDLVFSGQLELAVEDVVELVLRGAGPFLIADGLLSSARTGLGFSDTRAQKHAVAKTLARLHAAESTEELVCIEYLLEELAVAGWQDRLVETLGSVPTQPWLEALERAGRHDLSGLSEAAVGSLVSSLTEDSCLGEIVERFSLKIADPQTQSLVIADFKAGRVDLCRPKMNIDAHSLIALGRSPSFRIPLTDSSDRFDTACGDDHSEIALLSPLDALRVSLCRYARDLQTDTPRLVNVALADYRDLWGGDCWPVRNLALSAAAMRKRPATGEGNLAEGSSALEIQRWLAEAQEHSASVQWWVLEADRVSSEDELACMTFLAGLLTFASSAVLRWTHRQAVPLLTSLGDDQFASLVGYTTHIGMESNRVRQPVNAAMAMDRRDLGSAKFAVLLWLAGNDRTRQSLAIVIEAQLPHLWSFGSKIGVVLQQIVAMSSRKFSIETFKGSRLVLPGGSIKASALTPPLMAEAEEILRAPESWPTDVVRLAAEKLSSRLAGQSPVVDVATAHAWGT